MNVEWVGIMIMKLKWKASFANKLQQLNKDVSHLMLIAFALYMTECVLIA